MTRALYRNWSAQQATINHIIEWQHLAEAEVSIFYLISVLVFEVIKQQCNAACSNYEHSQVN